MSRLNTTLAATIIALAASALTMGCALTGKADALSVRYFNPETVKPQLNSATTDTDSQGVGLELGRVTSGIHLRDKIAYRDAAFEVGYYDDKRWTERPEVFVRRKLARTLFEEHGFKRSIGGGTQVATLEVEVIGFEEIKTPPAIHAARIQLRMVLHDGVDALIEKTVTVEQPIPPSDSSIDGLVRAMADALDAAAETVAKETQLAITKRAAGR